MHQRWMYAVVSILAVGFLAAASDSPMPTAPIGFIILAICIAKRKEEIGGWLLLFHIQNYQSILVTIPLLILNRESYVPSSWGEETGLYLLFILSVVPGLLWMPVELVFAERLRLHRAKPRAPGELPDERLRFFQRILYVGLGLATLGVVVDIAFFPDNIIFSAFAFVPALGWALYFQFSKRVQRVYVARNWFVVGDPSKANEPLDLVAPSHAVSPRDGGSVGVSVTKRDD